MLIQNNILRLDVSIDDTSTVEKGQGLDHTRGVESGAAFVQVTSETVECWFTHHKTNVWRRQTLDIRPRLIIKNWTVMKAWLKAQWHVCISVMAKSASNLNFLSFKNTYLSASRPYKSPPRQASVSMYRHSGSRKVLCSLWSTKYS